MTTGQGSLTIAEAAAYIAGMVDADGSIGFESTGHRLRVSVTNLSVDLMRFLQASAGGSFYLRDRRCAEGCEKQHVHVRQECYYWMLGGERAAILLRACLPYLIVKRSRLFHVKRQREEMAVLGWRDKDAPRLPARRCRHGHLNDELNCRRCKRDRQRKAARGADE